MNSYTNEKYKINELDLTITIINQEAMLNEKLKIFGQMQIDIFMYKPMKIDI